MKYSPVPVYSGNGNLDNLRIEQDGKSWHFLGRHGVASEVDILPKEKNAFSGKLPVLLGSGFGYALAEILQKTDNPVAVVDKEEAIFALSGVEKKFKNRVLWIKTANISEAMKILSRWQMQNGGFSFLPLAFPAYFRLDPSYYRDLHALLVRSQEANFWEKAKYPKFTSPKPRILLITSSYFLIGEVVTACKREEIPYHLLQLKEQEVGQEEFVKQFLKSVLEFRPDFVLTINHLGLDREGVLMQLLERLELPLASWFVDNPHLVLSLYDRLVSPWATLFTWDEDNISSLKALGFEHVFYLPLAADCFRFSPEKTCAKSLQARISFVGNSMRGKVAGRLRATRPHGCLFSRYKELANGFMQADDVSVREYFTQFADVQAAFDSLENMERQLAYETLITWQATLEYRLSCVKGILPLKPLIVGDRGWKRLLGDENWRYHAELNYYDDLPHFYRGSVVNFNCTSMQMKGAVNQRVFDVPASGSFLLTDYRRQLEDLFEPDKEVICFRSPQEACELADFYLHHDGARQKIVDAALKRVRSTHRYGQRLQKICQTMRQIYG